MEDISHKVKQGECIQTIAAAHGFADCKTIIEYEKNSRLRQKRPDMNCLMSGDVVVIPPKNGKPILADGKSRLKIVVPIPVYQFTLTLKDAEEKEISGAGYTLRIGSEVFEGKTAQNGLIRHSFKEKSEYAELELYPDDQDPEARQLLRLNIAHLDPVATPSGIQARLKNLGYYSGDVDGDKGPITKNAVRRFQESQGLQGTGDVCNRTLDRLNQIYG